jgi:hypothetical protein
MPIVASTLVAIGTFLAIWTAVSFETAPVLVFCLRAQQRAHAERFALVRREAWARATMR